METLARAPVANNIRPANATTRERMFTFGLQALSLDCSAALTVPRHSICPKFGFGSSARKCIVNAQAGANKAQAGRNLAREGGHSGMVRRTSPGISRFPDVQLHI